MRPDVRRRLLGAVDGMDPVLNHLQRRVQVAPPRRPGSAERVREAGEWPQGAVCGVPALASVRPGQGLRAVALGPLDPMQQRVPRPPHAKQARCCLCRWGRNVLRGPAGGHGALQPWPGCGRGRQVWGTSGGLPAGRLGRLVSVHVPLRGRPARAQTHRAAGGAGRGSAMRGQPRGHSALQHTALPRDGLPRLPVGQLVRLGRMLRLRRPEAAPPLHREASESLRPGMRGADGHRDVELHCLL
mmetsp:Transcript_41701/g.118954  ORF Transcript_41701/g.118954 Transcript_41701/m.118954 type:complete len:243 (-) Transcript_41701:81-809(-)